MGRGKRAGKGEGEIGEMGGGDPLSCALPAAALSA